MTIIIVARYGGCAHLLFDLAIDHLLFSKNFRLLESEAFLHHLLAPPLLQHFAWGYMSREWHDLFSHSFRRAVCCHTLLCVADMASKLFRTLPFYENLKIQQCAPGSLMRPAHLGSIKKDIRSKDKSLLRLHFKILPRYSTFFRARVS